MTYRVLERMTKFGSTVIAIDDPDGEMFVLVGIKFLANDCYSLSHIGLRKDSLPDIFDMMQQVMEDDNAEDGM